MGHRLWGLWGSQPIRPKRHTDAQTATSSEANLGPFSCPIRVNRLLFLFLPRLECSRRGVRSRLA